MPTFLSRKYDIDEISNSELELLTRPSAGQQVEMFSRAPSSRKINVYQLAEDDSGGKDEHLRKLGHFAAGSCNPFSPSKLKIVLGKCWRICKLFTQVLKPNSNTKVLRLWNKLFVISCFIGLFLDPLFFLTISISPDYKCVVFHNRWVIAFTVLRSVTDFIFLLHMLLQFRLAIVLNTGEVVVNSKAIALNYLRGWFALDVITVLPLPQIVIMVLMNYFNPGDQANFFKNAVRWVVLLQMIPRCIRFFPLLAGQSRSGFVFETAWANFIVNIFIYLLASHVVGCSWYLFGLQRVNVCLRNACSTDNNSSLLCLPQYLDCGYKNTINSSDQSRVNWIANTSATNSCLVAQSATFPYGIYSPMGYQVVQEPSVVPKYIYSIFWGFLQLSTLAGNQVPSLYIWEVLFTMAIAGLGLLLFALLIGNIQNFLQSLFRRSQEMQMRRYDVESWMRRRGLPEEMRKRVTATERFKWAQTRGVEEKELLSGLQEDLQMEIKRFISLDLVKKVELLGVMDTVVLDAICARLEQRLYIAGSTVMTKDSPIKRMLFIVHGKMLSVGPNGDEQELSTGSYCGEELLVSYLAKLGLKPRGAWIKEMKGQCVMSSHNVKCLENVDVFSLEADDLESITKNFYKHMSKPRVQGVLRNGSAASRSWAAIRIQLAWRNRLAKTKGHES
ncbi:unnamed protein product [Sphagnum compactum]